MHVENSLLCIEEWLQTTIQCWALLILVHHTICMPFLWKSVQTCNFYFQIFCMIIFSTCNYNSASMCLFNNDAHMSLSTINHVRVQSCQGSVMSWLNVGWKFWSSVFRWLREKWREFRETSWRRANDEQTFIIFQHTSK